MEHRGTYGGALTCVGQDKIERTFYYYRFSTFSLKTEYGFRVYASQDASDREFFEFTVVEEEDDSLKITMMQNNRDPRYTAKGIPDSLIPEIAKVMGRQIRSSSNRAGARTDSNEHRTPAATKVWKRLESKGVARYDLDHDIYYFLGNHT